MNHTLKKGSSVIYFKYPNVWDSIYADKFKVNLSNDVMVLVGDELHGVRFFVG